MKRTLTTAAILALFGTSVVHAQAVNLKGSSTNEDYVKVGPSKFPPFGGPLGYSGLQMRRADGEMSDFVDIYGGPITQVTNAIGANANKAGPYYANFPFTWYKIAQVWLNNQSLAANVYSLRQTSHLGTSSWPQFGGLVVGQVKGTNKGSGVYFGEWSQSTGSPSTTASAKLNMADASRTAWYVGDNAVTSMPTLVNALYDVVGINQTGTDAAGTVLAGGLPHAPNLYTGVLTANYNGSGGTLNGAISRSVGANVQTVDFAGTGIDANGSFGNGTSINGQFYNNADALAGVYRGSSTSNHVAFGGRRQ